MLILEYAVIPTRYLHVTSCLLSMKIDMPSLHFEFEHTSAVQLPIARAPKSSNAGLRVHDVFDIPTDRHMSITRSENLSQIEFRLQRSLKFSVDTELTWENGFRGE